MLCVHPSRFWCHKVTGSTDNLQKYGHNNVQPTLSNSRQISWVKMCACMLTCMCVWSSVSFMQMEFFWKLICFTLCSSHRCLFHTGPCTVWPNTLSAEGRWTDSIDWVSAWRHFRSRKYPASIQTTQKGRLVIKQYMRLFPLCFYFGVTFCRTIQCMCCW